MKPSREILKIIIFQINRTAIQWGNEDVFRAPPDVYNEAFMQKKLRDQLILAHCCLSTPPENIRKPKGFLMFSRGIDKQQEGSNGLAVNYFLKKAPS